MGTLPEFVRRRRLELRLTQREAAERAGLSLATWQNLERRTSEPEAFQDLTLARAAHSLRVRLPSIFEAAGRALPEALAGDGETRAAEVLGLSEEPSGADDGTGTVDDRLAHLVALLRSLADRSDESFMVVSGQAAEVVQHLLALHGREGPTPD